MMIFCVLKILENSNPEQCKIGLGMSGGHGECVWCLLASWGVILGGGSMSVKIPDRIERQAKWTAERARPQKYGCLHVSGFLF